MAKATEERDDDWGDWLGGKTFLWTLIGAGLFAAAVFLFIL